MKKSPRLIAIILTLFFSGSNSCQKEVSQEDPYRSEAIITGYDFRACVCCGGLMITFDGEPKPYTGVFRLIGNSAADIGISLTDTFPINVKVDWKEDTSNYCNHMLITRIARR
ncbi:MAG: hypothetical protein ABI472_16610 [Ginsengibacter sp.]